MSTPVTAQLILVQGDGSFQPIIELEDNNRSIGRAQNCDIIWGSLQISRKHATLEYLRPKWYIRDTSTNGLSVNNVKLVKGELFPLKDSDIISFIPTGAVRYRFRYIVPTSPPRGAVPPPRTLPRAVSPQPGTSHAAQALGSTSIRFNLPRAEIFNDTNAPGEQRSVELIGSSSSAGDSDDSNHSESLLSLDPHEDNFFNFSGDENLHSPDVVDADSDNASSGPSVSKRKLKTDSSSDESEARLDRKKKRYRPVVLDDDGSLGLDSSSKSDSHDSSNFKTLRCPQFLTEDQINKCDDAEMLKSHLRECMTKLKTTEVHLKSIECERAMEREDYRRKEHDVRSVNAAFKEETYKKIMELMESELSCVVCNEVYIQATVIDCGHTFCHFCINEWARKKAECPICRKSFRNRSRHIEMENFISRIFDSFSAEIAEKRKVSIKEREEQAKKAIEDARAAATENARERTIGGRPVIAGLQFAGDHYMDFLAELHQINEILGPRAGRGGAGTNAERRRSARIQDRVIDAVVAGAASASAASGLPAQGVAAAVRGRHIRGRGRTNANAAGAANATGAPAGVGPTLPSPMAFSVTRNAAAAAANNATARIPVVTLNDSTDDVPGGGMRFLPNQFLNYVRQIPIPQMNILGSRGGNGAAGSPNN